MVLRKEILPVICTLLWSCNGIDTRSKAAGFCFEKTTKVGNLLLDSNIILLNGTHTNKTLEENCKSCEKLVTNTQSRYEVRCPEKDNSDENDPDWCPTGHFLAVLNLRDEHQRFRCQDEEKLKANMSTTTTKPFVSSKAIEATAMMTGASKDCENCEELKMERSVLRGICSILIAALIFETIYLVMKKPRLCCKTRKKGENQVSVPMQRMDPGEPADSVEEINYCYAETSVETTAESACSLNQNQPDANNAGPEVKEAIYSDGIAELPDEKCANLACNVNIYERVVLKEKPDDTLLLEV